MCSFNADVLTMHDVLEGKIPVYHRMFSNDSNLAAFVCDYKKLR
jgi:hypothetical protein